MTLPQPYCGNHRRLLIALDIGTTFSGVSYSILEPGQVPEIKGVTRYPSQDHVGGDSKVPSIVLYDADGKFLEAGAEAAKMEEDFVDASGGSKRPWIKAEWFKLHMRPNPRATSEITKKIPPLPPTRTTVDVFTDFLAYLYQCTLTFIRETHMSGDALLDSVRNRTEFVIAHPNGWEGAQQAQLRAASVAGRLVPNTDEGKARIHFVTEGEAGLHFCVRHGLSVQALKNGEGLLIVDAGGGTVDLSAYGQKNASKEHIRLQEVAPPQSIFSGSVFVTRAAEAWLAARLFDSTFYDDVKYISRCFDKTTKLRFNKATDLQYVKFGRANDNNAELGVRSGLLQIPGGVVAKFFEPCITSIVEAVLKQSACATKKITTVLLIGGFSASDWLYRNLKDRLKPHGFEIFRPDSHLNKAVADGAASFYADHFVNARVARYTYGISAYVPYDLTKLEHRLRFATVFVDSDGVDNVQHVFDPILKKGTEVMEEASFRQAYFRKAEDRDAFPNPMTDDILCYRGSNEDPQWTDIEPKMYTKLCTVVSDISRIKKSLRPRRGKDGRIHYVLNYDVVLSFGLTELKAQVCWKEHGREMRSAAKILYDEDIP